MRRKTPSLVQSRHGCLIEFSSSPLPIELLVELLALAFLLLIFGERAVRREYKAIVHVTTVQVPEPWSEICRLVSHQPAHITIFVDDHFFRSEGHRNSSPFALNNGRRNLVP